MVKVKKVETESTVQKQIKEYLEVLGYSVYRINNTGIFNKERNAYIFHGTAGVPDLIALKRGQKILFIECKGTGKKPTEDQVEFMDMVNNSTGMMAVCADSLEKIIKEVVQDGT